MPGSVLVDSENLCYHFFRCRLRFCDASPAPVILQFSNRASALGFFQKTEPADSSITQSNQTKAERGMVEPEFDINPLAACLEFARGHSLDRDKQIVQAAR